MRNENNKSVECVSLVVNASICEYNRESSRIERLEQKAGFILAFTGVLITLLANLYDVLNLSMFIIVQAFFIIAVIIFIFVIKPGKASRFPLKEFCDLSEYNDNPLALGDEIVNTYWNVIEKSEELLSIKYTLFFCGLICLSLGLISIVVGVIL